jgi:hypothetical protein
MLETDQSSGLKRSQIAMAAAIAVISVLLMFGIKAAAAQACQGSAFCEYTGESFSGGEDAWGCLGAVGDSFTTTGIEFKSAVNHCGGQSYQIGWTEGGGTNWKSCLGPDEQRESPGRFDVFERVAGC